MDVQILKLLEKILNNSNIFIFIINKYKNIHNFK